MDAGQFEAAGGRDVTLAREAGDAIVRVDPRYFRPAEAEIFLGDPVQAKRQLGWKPRTSFSDLVVEMVHEDLEIAWRNELCSREGFRTFRDLE